ncbi:hypothetical protein [Stutzerimonas stutzeri]
MKASQIRALANIADKPGASVSTQLIATRRICRLFVMSAQRSTKSAAH